MSNIHQVLSEGSAIQLGPVEVTRVFPKNPGAKYSFSLVKDASGSTALKIWGAASNTELQVGQQVTLVGTGPRGGVKKSEYNGKISIDANDCRLEMDEQATQQPVQQGAGYSSYNEPREQVRAATGGSGDDKLPMVMARCAEATRLYVDGLINQGFSRDEAIMLAQNAPSYMPLWWFGEKGC